MFESENLNIVEAPNSGGKSSLIKALVGILSVPQDGKFDPIFSKEAKLLGIISDEFDTQKGFVNIHSEVGEVKLNCNNHQDELKIKQNGIFLHFPQYGDPKFLLSGILSNDTKILRQLRNTDEDEPDDFKWAVTRLSKAKNYDEIANTIKTEKESFVNYQDEAENLIERTKKLSKEIDDLKKTQQNVAETLIELGKRFKGGTEELIKKRQDSLKKVEEKQKDIHKLQSFSLNLTEAVEKINSDIKQKEEAIRQLEEILTDLKLYDKKIENLSDNELKKIKAEIISSINKEIEELKENRAQLVGVYNLYDVAQTSLKDKNKIKCPLCDQGYLDLNKLNKKLEDLKIEKEAISKQIMENNKTIRSLENEYEEILKQKTNLIKAIKDLNDEISDVAKPLLASTHLELDQCDHEIIRAIQEKSEAEKELEKLKELISLDDEETNIKYTESENKSKELTDQIAIKTNEINNYTLEIKGAKYKPNEILNAIKNYLKILEDLIDYSKKMADKQRQAAADKFNKTIKTLMNELDFKEFKDVKLNKEFRLYVERLDPRTNEYVSQLVSTLSTSEKLTIALMLQIAIKETYLPHVPFLILDDIMEDFDEDRRNKIYQYLLNKAREQHWVIISTKLKEEKIPIHVVNWKA